MGKDKKIKIILLSVLILFLSVSVTETVFAYGGGGKNPASESDSAAGPPAKRTDTVKKFTKEELENFFAGLPDGLRQRIIDKQVGKPRTLAQLNLIRSLFLDAEKFRNESDAAYWQSYEEVAVVLDKAGQNAELALAFTSGGTSSAAVKFITGTLFGASRAGLNAYNEGKSVGDIIQAIAVTIAVDNVMKLKNLERIGGRASDLVDMVSRAARLNKNPQVTKYLVRVGMKAGLVKYGEKLTKDQIGNIMNYMANQARNARPTRTSRPANIYTNQAGIW